MLRLLALLIKGDWHRHTYETVESRPYISDWNAEPYTVHYCRCTSCGSIKRFK